MHGLFYGFAQQAEIQFVTSQSLAKHFDQVYGAQIAALVWQQWLLAARIGTFNLTLTWCYVIAIEPV